MLKVPYSNRSVWKDLQQNCQDLKRVFAHLSSGTRPTAKSKSSTDVKRYLQKVVVGGDGVLVVIRSEAFLPRAELIVIPQDVVLGLLTAIHLRLSHPPENQLLQVFQRSFFALRAQQFAKVAITNCDLCQSLLVLPKELHTQSTIDLPIHPCVSFAADVIRRFRQKLFILRDTFSSFTCAELIPSEDAPVLRESLCRTIASLRSSPQMESLVRVDNAPGFVALEGDLTLSSLKIALDFGRVRNKNKNPVVDKGVRELIAEILRINPEGGQTNTVELSRAVNQLNSRIRGRGLSSWEILFRRDADTGAELDLCDKSLSDMQLSTRLQNQVTSAKHKASGGKLASSLDVDIGSLVYIKDDLSKLQGRDRYIVVRKEGSQYVLKKLLKNNVRSKEYSLKSTEIFPVVSNVLRNDSYLRGWEDDIEENDDDSALAYDDSTHQLPTTVNVDVDSSLRVPQPVETWIDVADMEGADEVVDQLPLQELVSSPSDEHRTVAGSSHADASHVGTPHDVDTSLVNDTPHANTPAMRSEDNVPVEQPRRSGRTTRQPGWLGDYVTEDVVKKVKGAKRGGRR